MSEDSDQRAVITLTPSVAVAARRMARAMEGASLPEVVKRGLLLLDLYINLDKDEQLVIRNKRTNQIDRVRFIWDTF